MSHSLGEIAALCAKAARGGGAPWGLCEEAGYAARWLASFGLPGPALLADMLEETDTMPFGDDSPLNLTSPWQAATGRLNPIIAGATLTDWADYIVAHQITLSHLRYPLLLVPFVAAAARCTGHTLALRWAGATFVTDGTSLDVDGTPQTITTVLTAEAVCAASTHLNAPQQPQTRGTLDAATAARLYRFAHRTYAPASEQSRMLGAGAGTTDND